MATKRPIALERQVLKELMKSDPLVEAYALCLLGTNDSSRIIQIIIDELNQLEIWIGSERHFSAMGSTLFSEKTYYILRIANKASEANNYPLAANIYTLLMNFCAKVVLSTNQADSEVENIYSSVFEDVSTWTLEDIPLEQIEMTRKNLLMGSDSKNMMDCGLADSFKKAFENLF